MDKLCVLKDEIFFFVKEDHTSNVAGNLLMERPLLAYRYVHISIDWNNIWSSLLKFIYIIILESLVIGSYVYKHPQTMVTRP